MLGVEDPMETNFKEKIRCGEVYRNLNGNQMFQKFYYRCLECSMDFESGPDFEEHVIAHYLQDDDNGIPETECENENVIDISSEEEDNAYLYAVEVTSMCDEVSECDLPLPIMQMLGQQGQQNDEENMTYDNSSDADDDDSNDQNATFPCKGLRNQALHQYSDPEKCCATCPAYFSTKQELEHHSLIHTMPDTVMCTHCYEVFPNLLKLHQHIRTRRKKLPNAIKKNGARIKCNNGNAKSQSETSTNMETVDIESDDEKRENNKGNNCIKAGTADSTIKPLMTGDNMRKDNDSNTKVLNNITSPINTADNINIDKTMTETDTVQNTTSN